MADEKPGWTTRRKLLLGMPACGFAGLGAWALARPGDAARVVTQHIAVPIASAKAAGSAKGGGSTQGAPALPTVNAGSATVVVITPRR